MELGPLKSEQDVCVGGLGIRKHATVCASTETWIPWMGLDVSVDDFVQEYMCAQTWKMQVIFFLSF